jgi:hypothetical protein
MATVTIKNKDGSINKKETARLKRNARLLETMVKKDMFGNVRGKRITEIPRDAILTGARKLMSIIPGSVGKEGKTQLQLERVSKQISKKLKGKSFNITNKAKGGKVGLGSSLVASLYKGVK